MRPQTSWRQLLDELLLVASYVHSYSQACANAALPSDALGCFTLRVTQKVVREEDSSESHSSARRPTHSLLQFFPVCFIRSIHIQNGPFSSHSTSNLSVWQSLYQTVWSGENRVSLSSGVHCVHNLHDAGYALGGGSAQTACGNPQDVIKPECHFCLRWRQISGWVYIKGLNMPSSFPQRPENSICSLKMGKMWKHIPLSGTATFVVSFSEQPRCFLLPAVCAAGTKPVINRRMNLEWRKASLWFKD